MSFAWRELWSREVETGVDLEFSISEGVVLSSHERRITHIVRDSHSAGSTHRGTPLCCWNGDFVFSAVHDYLRDYYLLCRHRKDELETQKLVLPKFAYMWSAIGLNDGNLFVRGQEQCFLIRDDIDGQMKVIKEYGNLGAPYMKPWMDGILYADGWNVVCDDLRTQVQIVYMQFNTMPARDAIFSDKKHACVISGTPAKLHEWAARNRGRIFLAAEGSIIDRIAYQSGTCRGGAFLNVSVNTPGMNRGAPCKPCEAFLYVGGGRFVAGPEGHGQWAAYGNRAYLLSDDTTLKCYEALETSDMLVNLCARSAASLGLSDERLQTVPVELRELVSSWT